MTRTDQLENFGASPSGTSKTRHGTRALYLITHERSPRPVRHTTPITKCGGWTPLRPNTFAFIKNGTQEGGDEEQGSEEEEDIKAEQSISGPL